MNPNQHKMTDETQAILDRIMTGKALDPETYRRIRQRGQKITEELRRQHGEMNIAVDLIRETREEE